MAVIKRLYDLIKPLTPWADAVYLKRLPQSNVSSGQTFILITETSPTLGAYASNTFNEVDFGLKIQIFYALNFTQDMEALELKLIKLLEQNGYLTQTIRGRIQDPDTHQDYQTILINKRSKI